MRYLSLAVLLLTGILGVAVVAPFTPSAARDTPVRPLSGRVDNRLFVASDAAGLYGTDALGRAWSHLSGLPRRGGFYSLVADSVHPGWAYAANGDVYVTTNHGNTWRQLPRPPAALGVGPAGITALACDLRDGTLYAAGNGILAYTPASRHWSAWGQNWPRGVHPTALLSSPDGRLYAAADGRLFFTTGRTAVWRDLPTQSWHGAPIAAMAIGPNGQTPFIAVQGWGIWYVDVDNGITRVEGDDPPGAVTALGSDPDPTQSDLYAATSDGLFVRHQPLSFPQDDRTAWRRVRTGTSDAIVALGALPARHEMLALARGGTILVGRRPRDGGALSWHIGGRTPATAAPVTALLAGAEWRRGPHRPILPVQFTQGCVPVTDPLGASSEVCGPFRDFYLSYGQYRVLGYPQGQATVGTHGMVTQLFGNVKLAWTQARGPYLLPVWQQLEQGRHFRRPSRKELANVSTPYFRDTGYYVDPHFAPTWGAFKYEGAYKHLQSIFGPPISQVLSDQSSDGSGRSVLVQYFTNARFEYHEEGQQSVRISALPQSAISNQ